MKTRDEVAQLRVVGAQPQVAQQPATSSHGQATSAEAATEVVTRPEPGLARGAWEAPAWVFWVVLGAVVVGSAAYLLRRLGMLRIGKTPDDAPSSISPASRRRRP
jgi:hypothetical protein